MLRILTLLLIGGCQGGRDTVHIGYATGLLQKWDTADCTCTIDRSLEAYGGDPTPLIVLTASVPSGGNEYSGALFIAPLDAQGAVDIERPNTIVVMDVWGEYGAPVSAATVEISSEVFVDEDGSEWNTVWIDHLAWRPLDIALVGGSLGDARMSCLVTR